MKPQGILSILDLARRARKNGDVFNPLFVGPPGIGKSQIIQQWCNERMLPFIDLRAAYLEAPDLIGFPTVEKEGGRQVTKHNLPEFWPTTGEGVLLLEEPNRGTTSVLNTFMQLLTDRKVHNYSLPKGWIVVGAINPEDSQYDVNTMDPALKDRFEFFTVDFNKSDFINYMTEKKWDSNVKYFIESGSWEYVLPENVGENPGSKYLSPRTFSKLNAAEKAGVEKEVQPIVYESILGRNMGIAFYAFKHKERPVLWSDIKKNLKSSLKELRTHSDPSNYKSGHISITIRSIIEEASEEITQEVLASICLVLPAEHSVPLIREMSFKTNNEDLLSQLFKIEPALKDQIKKIHNYKS